MSTMREGNSHVERNQKMRSYFSANLSLLYQPATDGLDQTGLASSATQRGNFLVNGLKYSLVHAVSQREDMPFSSWIGGKRG